MATQNSGHAPLTFSTTHPFRPVRLLEVPDDLLDLITNHPFEVLKFKSAPTGSQQLSSTSGSGSMSTAQQRQGLREPILHLCSGSKAWAVKQVSTSNSVYLMEPSVDSGSTSTSTATATQQMGENGNGNGNGDGDTDTEMRDPELDSPPFTITTETNGMTAIAQVHNFLELHPVKLDLESITSTIVDLLPIHHPLHANEDINLDLQASNDSKRSMSLSDLIDDVAAPDLLVRRACSRLGVFESSSSSSSQHGGGTETRCMIPSTRAVLTTWTKLLEACAIENADIESEFLYVSQIAGRYLDDTERAVLESMRGAHGMFESFGLLEAQDQNQDQGSDSTGPRRLRLIETARFIGALILSSQDNGDMSVQQFMSLWTDLVPTVWVKSCTLDILGTSASASASETGVFEVKAENGGDGVIYWKGRSVARGVVLTSALLERVGDMSGEDGNVGGTKVAAAAVPDKRRKWHEKFGAQRSKR